MPQTARVDDDGVDVGALFFVELIAHNFIDNFINLTKKVTRPRTHTIIDSIE